MKEIFYELINEAVNGEITIDNEIWPCSFNTIINNFELINHNNISTLVIKDEKIFLNLLEEYILLEIDMNRKFYHITNEIYKNKIKAIIMFLFINATPTDFVNPNDYLKKRIAFLKDTTFDKYDDYKKIKINNEPIDSIQIQKQTQSITMETPYKITISITNEQNINIPIAEISYGIDNKTCYIYSIMKPKEKKNISNEEISFKKILNRYLYKLNEGILEIESNEFKNYKKGLSQYYPENITDVTHAFVLAAAIFITLLQKEQIYNIKIVPYLPIRYQSREIVAQKQLDKETKNALLKRNETIQENATNKLLRTFRRIDYHYGQTSTITSYPYEQDEFMTIKLSAKQNPLNNSLLNKINDIILENEKTKLL